MRASGVTLLVLAGLLGSVCRGAQNDEIATLAASAARHAAAGEHRAAIADYDRLLELDPDYALAYDQRGSQYFVLGEIEKSIADFDHYLALKPDQEAWHWKRGISYYYAGRYDEGRRQFEGYQTVDDSDVENAVWRYLCMARDQGAPAAREGLLKIKTDARVPMMEIYALYAGKATPEGVLAAARAGSPTPEALNARLFYAHLYLGLFYEAAGDAARAKAHLQTAARKHKIGHYMWNVADVHVQRLEAAARSPVPRRPG
jgi:lipoprotein NlpI